MGTYAINKRWRKKHNDIWQAGKKRYYDKTRDAVNSRRRWTIEEIKMLERNDLSDHELAKLLGRSVQAIQVKRCKWLGRSEVK